MTRLQKKCFFVSLGMHGLLLLILFGSSAFRSKPVEKDIPILTMIPANILDKEGAGGGSPGPAAAPQSAPPQPQPVQPVAQPPPPVAPQRQPEPLEPPKPKVVEREPEPPKPEAEPEIAREPAPKPARKTHEHEIHPTFDPVTPTTRHKTRVKTSETDVAETSAQSSADARRLQRQIAKAMDALASGVRSSGAQGTVVDMPGQGGGEAFAGYETVIYNAYYRAWITPDGVADRRASADVKIVVARDGTILSAEIINKSGEPALDSSVERALRKVQSLPAFPAGAHDEQRSFLLRFNLESKEGSG